MLELQPDMIYLKFENAKWRVHDDLEKGVYPLKVTGKIWNISENTKMKAKRWGWCFVPDFGQTAHSVQGASLKAVIVDCLKVDICSKETEMLAAYIGLSRVRRKEALLIAEPFSPALFGHGQPPPGPEILMKVLRREITADDSKKDECCSLCLCVSLCCYLRPCASFAVASYVVVLFCLIIWERESRSGTSSSRSRETRAWRRTSKR